MPTYKMSVICDTIQEFMEVAELLLSKKKGNENDPDHKDSDSDPVDSRSRGETGARNQGEPQVERQEVPAAATRRGRPKKSEKVGQQATLLNSLTLDQIKAQARTFAQNNGAPALIEALGSFGAKSTLELKPEDYAKFSETLTNFKVNDIDEASGEDPFNDLL